MFPSALSSKISIIAVLLILVSCGYTESPEAEANRPNPFKTENLSSSAAMGDKTKAWASTALEQRPSRDIALSASMEAVPFNFPEAPVFYMGKLKTVTTEDFDRHQIDLQFADGLRVRLSVQIGTLDTEALVRVEARKDGHYFESKLSFKP